MNSLRPYQVQAIQAVKERWLRGKKRQLITLPTGLGKTVVFSNLAKELGITKKVLVLAHRQELLQQAADKYAKWNPGLNIGVEKAELRAGNVDVVVASVQTLRKGSSRLSDLNPNDFGLIITDECHHCISDSYLSIYEHFGVLADTSHILHCGVTATANRSDGTGLHSVFSEIAYSMDILTSIKDGWLSNLRAFKVVTGQSLDGVKSRAGDFATDELAQAVNNAPRNEIIVKHWKELCENRTTLGFAVDVAHAKALAECFNQHGITSAAVWGEDPMRAKKLDDLTHGRIKVLWNCAVLCLDSETEILTEDGWANKDTIKDSSLVANWGQDKIFFERPKQIFIRKRNPDEKMISLETPRRSIRTTSGHIAVYRNRIQKEWRRGPIDNLVGKVGFELPVSGMAEPYNLTPQQPPVLGSDKRKRLISAASYNLRKLEGFGWDSSFAEAARRIDRKYNLKYKNPEELSLDECRLIGFFIGDGSSNNLNSGGIEYTFSQDSHCRGIIDWFDNLMISCKLDHLKKVKNKTTQWHLSRGTGGGSQERRGVFHLEPYLKKSGTSLYWALNEKQIGALLEGFWFADGNHGDDGKIPVRGFRICNTNLNLLNLLQALAVCRGYRTSIRKGPKPKKENHNQLYYLSFTKQEVHRLNYKGLLHEETQQQDEIVWCVQSTSGNIVTRRKGSVTILGNCEGYDEWRIGAVVMARPTKSGLLFTQCIGRGTRIPEGVNNLIEARAQGIKLEKEDCIVLDVVDSCRNSLVTIPALFGLGPLLDMKGKDILTALKKVEEIEEAHPQADLKDAPDLDTLASYATSIDLFTIQWANEVLEGSTMQWHRAPDGHYVLRTKERRIEVFEDLLQKWNVKVTMGEKVGIKGDLRDLPEAFSYAENYVRDRCPAEVTLVKREAKWHKEKASEAQIRLLKKFRVPIMPGLTKGGAQLALNRLLKKG